MAFRPRRLPALLLACALLPAAGCGPAVDLEQDIELADVETGYFDNGLKDGSNHMLPSVSFRIRNVSDHDVSSIMIMVSFWVDDPAATAAETAAAVAAGREPPAGTIQREISSAQVRGVTGEALAPGAQTDPIVVRPNVGYTLEGPISEFFVHSDFEDVTARVFGRRSGALVPLGEFVLERRIVTSAPGPDAP